MPTKFASAHRSQSDRYSTGEVTSTSAAKWLSLSRVVTSSPLPLVVVERKTMSNVTPREYKVVIIADGQQLSSRPTGHRQYVPAATSSLLAMLLAHCKAIPIDRLVPRLLV